MSENKDQLLLLLKLQQTLIEELYDNVLMEIKSHTTTSNQKQIITNIPMLKMKLQSSRQRIIVKLKAHIREYGRQLNE